MHSTAISQGLSSWQGLDFAVRLHASQSEADWYRAMSVSKPAPIRLKPRRAAGGEVAACIRQRENGGSYERGSNPSHFGAYQFSRSTWAANGGDPNEWGTASAEEQDRVFANTVARNGYRDWTPYDGCGA